jgi:hypothetical protein
MTMPESNQPSSALASRINMAKAVDFLATALRHFHSIIAECGRLAPAETSYDQSELDAFAKMSPQVLYTTAQLETFSEAISQRNAMLADELSAASERATPKTFEPSTN